MIVTLRPPSGPAIPCSTTPGVLFATTEKACACGSFRARGGPSYEQGDSIVADASCFDCGAGLGTLVARFNTLFGVAEDRAVLVEGRARVYGGEQG